MQVMWPKTLQFRALPRWLLSSLRRPLPAAGLLLALLALAWLGRTLYLDRQFTQHLEGARAAEETFDLEGAWKHLDACVGLRPKDADVRLRRARVARRLDDLDAAEKELEAYEDLRGGATSEGVLEHALLLAQQGELPLVEPLLNRRLAEGHPQSLLILEALAKGFIQVYSIREAKNVAVTMLARDRNSAAALLLRGKVAVLEGLPNEGVERFRAAVQLQPEHAPARLLFAQTLLRLGRGEEALPHLERLHTRRPSVEITFSLAQCCRITGRCDRAAELLEGLLQQRPGSARILAERGRLALEMDDLPQAEEALRRAAALLPNDRPVHYDLALCLAKQGRAKEASRYYRRSTELYELEQQLTRAVERSGQFKEDPEPRFEAGMICLRTGQVQQGLRWLHGALQVAPNHRRTHEALAEFYENAGQPERAAQHRLALGQDARKGPPGR
jgi:tetratricopeptide (TPR) repeat protein